MVSDSAIKAYIDGFLKQQDIIHHRKGRDSCLVSFDLQTIPYGLVTSVQVRKGVITATTPFVNRADVDDAETMRRVAEFLHRASLRLRIGSFELDCDTGEARFRYALTVGDTLPDPYALGLLLVAGAFAWSRYGTWFYAVLAMQADPKTSIDKADAEASKRNGHAADGGRPADPFENGVIRIRRVGMAEDTDDSSVHIPKEVERVLDFFRGAPHQLRGPQLPIVFVEGRSGVQWKRGIVRYAAQRLFAPPEFSTPLKEAATVDVPAHINAEERWAMLVREAERRKHEMGESERGLMGLDLSFIGDCPESTIRDMSAHCVEWIKHYCIFIFVNTPEQARLLYDAMFDLTCPFDLNAQFIEADEESL